MKRSCALVSKALALLLCACGKIGSTPAPRALWKDFSGEKALSHVATIVNFGPRPSGSAALEETRVYITNALLQQGWLIERQGFTAQTPRGSIEFVNLIARHTADRAKPRFLITTHYDTKRYDTIPFVGANDAGSGTGALLELARVLAADPAVADEVELVFFDGEEALNEFDESDGLYGSRHFASELVTSGRSKQFRWAILWDMIGDADLTITLPADSPRELVRGILQAADKLGVRRHFSFFQSSVMDDHVPLNEIGIPAIDLIDFDYPPWHTAGDTLDKLSAESLKKVADVTLCFLLGEVLK
jgi:Zn-dependent M28 family amino/carboxypeptidase